jgi:hypothetical protein
MARARDLRWTSCRHSSRAIFKFNACPKVRHEGHIKAGGGDKDVTFFDVGPINALNDQIDATYWGQYPQYIPPVLTPKARDATIKLIPCSEAL